MAARINPEKKVDLPPKGKRNADPFTDTPGAHLVETGVGPRSAARVPVQPSAHLPDQWVPQLARLSGPSPADMPARRWARLSIPQRMIPGSATISCARPYVREGDTFEKYQPAYRYGGVA